ncbi:hypothetical protein COZ45_01305 [Candidatus Uhrbacteria bacterium CG_4_10_14_3_um_filter_41_21]|nr:MAG: hypothetical protein COZ45_01305 [Candidatus Uhrbacteria bacterium CG_4_10_14_3_um_filter_41_21]
MKNSFKNQIAFGLFVAILLTPVIIWLTLEPISDRFEHLWQSIGQISGLLGIVLLSLNLFLSARLRRFEKFLPGINKIYEYHHHIGGTALILLLLHPVSLALTFASTSFYQAFLLFIPADAVALALGQYSLYGLLALLIITFYINLPYEWWRLSHALLGVPLLLGSLHMLLIPSDVSRSPALKYYLLVLILVGLSSYLYRTVFGSWLVKRYKYEITEVQTFGSITEITAKPVAEAMPYLAGQYAFLQIPNLGFSFETHPFSVSSAPTKEGTVRFSIKNSGDFTSQLKDLAVGTRVKLEGGYGVFTAEQCIRSRQVWIAGGIGITPFLALAGELNGETVDLFYCVNTRSEAVYEEGLLALKKSGKNINVHLFCSDKDGRITADYIAKSVADIQKTDIFVCGPPAMMTALKNQFKDLGISKANIHSEEFSFS